MNQLTDAGIPAAVVAKKIKFNFGISSNYFLEIAKFRAARLLWANIVASYKPECLRDCSNKGANGECRCAAKMAVHAETSTFNLTLFDAHVNLLRTQTEAMSAALAGVDSMTVVPFDKTYSTPDEFSERLARNQQLLLKEESHFDKVIDPAAGSYFIENLTVSIAKQAWDLFLNVEEEGGMLEAVKAGKVQEAVNASNKARHDAVSKRKEVLLGTNQFPNFNEKAGEKNPVEAQCCCSGNSCEKPIATLNFNRAASEFEALRLQTERSGKRPKAFMLTIGNLAMRQARAQFSCNFLACAGYEVIDNLGFPTVEEGVEAAMKAGADIVVICSSDDEYAEYAVPAFKALNGRAMFIVAGAPACMDELKAAGIENFIHRIFRYKLKKYSYWDDPDNAEEAVKVPVNARHVKHMILAGCFDRIEKVGAVTERCALLERAARELGFSLSEKDFPQDMRGRHFFWSQQQIAVSGIGSINYRRIFDNSEASGQVKGKASYLTLDEVARDENDGRRAAVCATVVDVAEHTYKDRETGSRKRFARLTLSQNNRLAECVCWNDYYMEHRTEIQSLKDRVVILTAVIRYSDYNGCNTLQTYKNSLLFIQS